ncbi:hypothetical protein GCM10025789_31040 [Tessaracoccus lubricantis]|uniref:HTH cro/C1-type domain-containing protein n=1 Tax=Tessaracoccus lubricantis TaxID=545543 RepID=A0ABP9FP72_9ACTN
MLFGTGPVALVRAEERDADWRDEDARAATAQSDIARAIFRRMAVMRKSQAALARDVGIHPKTLSRLLHGRSWMELHDAIVISQALRVNLVSHLRALTSQTDQGRLVPAFARSEDDQKSAAGPS